MPENEKTDAEQPEEAAEARAEEEAGAEAAKEAAAAEEAAREDGEAGTPETAEAGQPPASPERVPEPQEDELARLQRWIAKDTADFTAAYPDVDLAKLDGDAAFRKFCGTRYAREPLAQLYGDWLDLTETVRRSAAARSESKATRSTGAGGGSGAETLTAAQQRALDEWNRSYPHRKMSAKEYLSR